MNSAKNPYLKDIEWFLSQCVRRKFPARSTLINEGEASNTLYFIIKGTVTVLIEDSDDHEMIIAYLNAGEFFGEMGLFDDSAQRSACIRAKTECEIGEISYTQFHQLAHEHPELLFALGAQLTKRLRATTRKVGDLAFLDVAGRVARTLLDLCKQPDAITHPDGMQIKITRQDIGRLVGCSREMAGRVLKTLEDQGLVSVSGKTMVVFGTR